jgi:hypothetical protein
MFAPIASQTKRSACRRQKDRRKIKATHVTCWSECDPVAAVAAIEADTHGARLMLPWNVQAGENLVVSVANEVGLYQTQVARVAWTERLELTGRVIAGVEFREQLKVAV